MIIRVDSWSLEKAFRDMGRGDQFSTEALETLLEYYDEDYELDVIAICCDWTEYTMEYLVHDYGYMYTIEEYMDDMEIEVIDDVDMDEYYNMLIDVISNRCTVIRVNDDCVLVGE